MKKSAENSGNKYKFPKKKYNEDIKRFINGSMDSLKPGSLVLDAGCDTGYLSRQFAPECRLIGIDANLDAIRECRKNCSKAEYEVADLCLLPFKDNFFDVVILNMVIEHIEDTDKLLLELRRALKPGGLIVMTTPNYANILWVIIESIWFMVFENSFKPYLKEVHPSKFTGKKLSSCLAKYFKKVNMGKITYGFTLTAVVSK